MLACFLLYNVVEKDHLRDLRIHVCTHEEDTLKKRHLDCKVHSFGS